MIEPGAWLFADRYRKGLLHRAFRGHYPDWRWYDVGWADVRGCEICETKKAMRYRRV